MEDKLKDYRKFVGDSSDFNRRLSIERRQRLPYMDAQTGIAQSDCLLWREARDRLETPPPPVEGASPRNRSKVFLYPASRWQKRRREYLIKREYPYLNMNRLDVSGRLQPSHSTPTTSSMPVPPSSHLDLMEQLEPSLVSMPYRDALKSSSVVAGDQQSDIANSSFHLSIPLPSQPPRSGSVGSYSCIDSDSRDQSSATSQSVDSPHRTHMEDDQMYQNHNTSHMQNGSALEHSSGMDSGCCKDTNGYNEVLDGESLTNATCAAETTNKCLLGGEENEGRSSGIKIIRKEKRRHNSLLLSSPSIKNKGFKQNNGYLNGTTEPVAIGLSRKGAKVNIKIHNDDGDDPPRATIVSGDRPYVCTICDQSYKTRPGLSYHFIHVHDAVLPKKLSDKRYIEPAIETESQSDGSNAIGKKVRKRKKAAQDQKALRCSRRLRGARVEEEGGLGASMGDDQPMELNNAETDCSRDSSDKTQDAVSKSRRRESISSVDERNGNLQDGDESSRAESDKTVIEASLEPSDLMVKTNFSDATSTAEVSNDQTNESKSKVSDRLTTRSKQNIFCDFCLGTAERNRKTRLPEELISCTSCGSSGHPSCLQFSDKCLLSVKKYQWQCIDCKTCAHCNTAQDEAKLLICNDCDRSYHTYCLQPPLEELPEEIWSCGLCVLPAG